ncbi:MAG: PAS domain-containing protein, partial [Deltaproteobacteria bacterium]|nr:PAS domain-containing protein [Deltaproteobacteria bacterium]
MMNKPNYEELLKRVTFLEKELAEKAHLEETLRETVLMSQDILEKAADGICVCHNIREKPYVKFTHWNPRMIGITGYTMEEINKLGWYQTMYPDPEVQKRAIERMAKMREGDDIQAEEWMITTKSGQKRPLSMSTSIVKEENGKVHVLAVIQDITERKNAEEALRNSEEKFRFLAEKMVDIVWTTNLDFQTTYVSPSIKNVLGFTPEERKRQSLEEMITPESLAKVQLMFVRELQRDEEGTVDPDRSVTIEVEYYRKDG